MILPKIVTKHKIRDAKICRLWVQDLLPIRAIAKRFGLSATRINTILSLNREFIKADKDWEKSKRVIWIKQQIKKRGNSKKDSADLQQQLKHEIEGDKPLIDNSKHTHLTIVQQIREVLKKDESIDERRVNRSSSALSV